MGKLGALLASILCGSVCTPTANAAEIYSIELDAELVAIAVEGDIASGDGEAFRREAAKHSDAVVLLESDGGSTLDAIEIGEAIRLRGFSTLVFNNMRCVSACGLIWLAGTPRVLSESAQIGFHATYVDEAGQQLESGVGNALVGRYFTLLNLPTKAIIFATEAGPHELNWLSRANYLDTGIDVQFVDDWDQSAVPAVTASPPPPIKTRPTQSSSAPTEMWQTIAHWYVMVDHTLGDSCFLISEFNDGTSFRIGLDRKAGGQSYVALANDAWMSLAMGDQHGMSFQFDDHVPWEAQADVVDFGGVNALMVTFTDTDFWAEFALSEWLKVATGSRRVATLSLDRSQAALEELVACQRFYNSQWNGRDPFAK